MQGDLLQVFVKTPTALSSLCTTSLFVLQQPATLPSIKESLGFTAVWLQFMEIETQTWFFCLFFPSKGAFTGVRGMQCTQVWRCTDR